MALCGPSASCSPRFRPVADDSGSGPSGGQGWGRVWSRSLALSGRLPPGQFPGGLYPEAPSVVRNVPFVGDGAAFGPDDLPLGLPGVGPGAGAGRVCVCMSVSCVSTHLCVPARVSTCICAPVCVHLCVHVSPCAHMHVSLCLGGCMCVFMCIRVCACVCICLRMSMCLWGVSDVRVHVPVWVPVCMRVSVRVCMCQEMLGSAPAPVGPGRRLRGDGGAAAGTRHSACVTGVVKQRLMGDVYRAAALTAESMAASGIPSRSPRPASLASLWVPRPRQSPSLARLKTGSLPAAEQL